MPITDLAQTGATLFLNPSAKKDDRAIIKRFVSPASSVAGGGNGVTSLDDPTYLGFLLRFDILSPLFNGGTTGEPARPPSETPLFDSLLNDAADGFAASTATANVDDGTSVNTDLPASESAVGYLKTVGDLTRASYLTQFLQGLREVNQFRPYYWQTIEGLTEAYNKTFIMEDPYQGSSDAEGIVIGCLEAIDLKISAIFNLYKAAVYDAEYKRFVLPKNLMYFKVEVDVFEIRRFKAAKNFLEKLNPNTPPNEVDRFLNDNTSKITFVFDDCVWVPGESGKVFGNVTNAGGNTMAMSGMKWTYGSLMMKSDFAGIDQELNDASKKQSKGGLGAAVKQAAKQQAAKAAGALSDRAARAAQAAAQGVVLGNAFGLRNQIFGALQNPGALVSAVEGSRLSGGGSPNTNIRLGDNILGEGIQPNNSLPSGNLLVGQIPQINTSLNSSNIFGAGPSGPLPLTSNNVFG